MSLTGQIYPFLVEETRFKPGAIWTMKGNVHTLAELKQVLVQGLIFPLYKNSIYAAFPPHVHGQFIQSILSSFMRQN